MISQRNYKTFFQQMFVKTKKWRRSIFLNLLFSFQTTLAHCIVAVVIPYSDHFRKMHSLTADSYCESVHNQLNLISNLTKKGGIYKNLSQNRGGIHDC